MKRIITTAAAGVLALGWATSALAEKWDMPMAYPATNFHSETAKAFADAVKAGTGGKLEIVTHPNGSLFKGDEIFRAVRTGQAQIGERLISALGNDDPLFELDGLPFLAASYDDAWKLYEASKPELGKLLESKGVKLLYTVAWPPQGLYAKKPIASGADMKGVKFRAYNQATARLAELMGAIPTKIEAAEISQAFSTGVAESMISSGSTGYDSKLWEFTKYWYDTNAWLPKNMVIVNKAAWDGLDKATQDVVLKAAADAEKAGWAKSKELADWYKTQLKANGMTVEPPSAALAADFKTIGETMVGEWVKKAGAPGQAVVDRFKKM